MIKIKIKVSYPLIEGILQTKFEQEKLNKQKEVIEQFLNLNNEQIIRTIENITGYSFNFNSLNIWLINGTYPTSVNPNLLNVENEKHKITFDLIYILIHNTFDKYDFYNKFLSEYGIDEAQLEAAVYLTTKKVIFETKVIKENEFIEFLNKTQKDLFNKYIWDEVEKLETKINFSKPIKEFNP